MKIKDLQKQQQIIKLKSSCATMSKKISELQDGTALIS